ARTRYTARAGKVDVQAVEKHVPGGAAAVSQLVRQAEALAEGGDPGGAAGKYAEAEAQLAGAAEMAERLALQAAQQAERAYRDTRDTVAKLLAATDRVRLERHAPGAVTSVLAIVRLADGYARKGEFPAAAAECAKAREFLADADRRAQRQASAAPPDVVTPPAGPIALEMAHIENLLKQRQTRTAVTRVTRNLFDLWKQRRTQWAELGQWVDQTGAKYPALLTVGRYRLPALKRQLKEYAAQEEKWQGTVKAVQATADLREKIAKLDQFLRYNYSSFYRVDAVALQDKIRDELARRRR
ncbi:hypothetical protein HQ560_01230, partial [bacterium]|nr:hypothetical protein [bacterium]